MQQAFHVIFVVDRSGSMTLDDRRPLANTPATSRIAQHSDNRLGAVYSALYSFWSARHAAVIVGTQSTHTRRDAYSIIFFDHTVTTGFTNDFTSSPDQLLEAVLPYESELGAGTNFTLALQSAQQVVEQNFSTERSPVIIFLSDGECVVSDQTVQDLCRLALRLGKPLSFHAISFGQESESVHLRRMVQIALDIQNDAPQDPLAPVAATLLSSYSQALDTVRMIFILFKYNLEAYPK
jgi:Mg-chelatase subunit ChlD